MVDTSTLDLAEERQSAGIGDSVPCVWTEDERWSTARSCAPTVRACSDINQLDDFRKFAGRRLATLTKRQKQILDRVIAGEPSKNIAMALGISQRTVDSHRSHIATRTGTKTLAALVQLATCGRCALASSQMVSHEDGAVDWRETTALDKATVNHEALERQIAQEENEALKVDICELQHRMKNMMSIIQSIARQSARQSSSKDEFLERFSGRLLSFSKANDLLVANQWRGIELDQLVRSQLAIFGLLDGAQIRIEGPELILSPKGAHNIGLAIYELATNASKYGALSEPKGAIQISWSEIEDESGRRLHFSWQEVDGPYVPQPTRCGFGRQILERLVSSALSGKSTYSFQPKGIAWTLDAPSASALV